MSKLFKSEYMLLMFLIVNMTAENVMFASLSKVLFYCVLALSVPVCLLNIKTIKEGFRACPYMLLWILIYIVYQLSVGLQYATLDNLIYLVAKITTFSVMLLSIGKDFNLYMVRLSKPMGIIIVLLLLIGFNKVGNSGTHSFGFYNGNAGCAVAMIGAASFLFKNAKYALWEKFCLVFCLMCVLIGSSRNSLAMLAILVLFRYGASPKLIFAGIVGIIGIVFILPELGFETESVDRLLGTFDGTVSIDRENQREAARWMIEQHPWDGNGFNFQNYGYALDLTDLGAHNGYLNMLEQMGYGFGGLWLVVLALGVYRNLMLYKEKNLYVRKYIAIMAAILFGANQESYLSGVNQFTTNMLYVSMAILWMYRYKMKNMGIKK